MRIESPWVRLLGMAGHVYGWEECMEEMFPAASQEFGHVVETNFTILDLAGISVSDIWDSEVPPE